MENLSTGRPTAPVLARYRCFLPDLAGLAGIRRVGPGTASSLPNLPGELPHAASLFNFPGFKCIVFDVWYNFPPPHAVNPRITTHSTIITGTPHFALNCDHSRSTC